MKEEKAKYPKQEKLMHRRQVMNLTRAELAKKSFKHTQLSIVDVLSKEEIAACQKIADDRGIYLKIRKFS